MKRIKLYRETYNILEKVTPLRFDCGVLCNKVCCQSSGEEETGMYLFPGEEIIYSSKPDWLTIKKVHWSINPDRKVYLAVCSGTCNRSIRPLACRIFPLIPYIGSLDILQIKMDIRAKSICPLVQQGRTALNPDFIQKVRKAAKILITNSEIKNFIKELSCILDEYGKLL